MPQSNIAPPLSSENTSQTPVQGAANGAAGAQTATLAGVAGKRTYISGVAVNGFGATGAATASLVISPLQGGNLTISVEVPAGVTTPIQPLVITFNPPIPCNAVQTAITAVLATFGAGNTDESVAAWGFQQST